MAPKRRVTPGCGRKESLGFAERGPVPIVNTYLGELLKLDRAAPGFLTSQEETLEDESQAINWKPAYAALPLAQFNHGDEQEKLVTEYARKVQNGGILSTYLKMVTVAGQFLPLHDVLGFTDVKKWCEPGSLYKAVCDR